MSSNALAAIKPLVSNVDAITVESAGSYFVLLAQATQHGCHLLRSPSECVTSALTLNSKMHSVLNMKESESLSYSRKLL
eukprot:m.60920 g.60920  ORF g.60920 m.60920 type:complete len:79 (-) comp11840_c0_seq2:12-248(-)